VGSATIPAFDEGVSLEVAVLELEVLGFEVLVLDLVLDIAKRLLLICV